MVYKEGEERKEREGRGAKGRLEGEGKDSKGRKERRREIREE